MYAPFRLHYYTARHGSSDAAAVAVVVVAAARMQLQVAREQIATAKEHAAYIARMLSSLGVILAVSIKRPLAFEVFRALGT